MSEDSNAVRRRALQIVKEISSPFSNWEFFKSFHARFGSKLQYSDLGFTHLCDFIESLPDVKLVGSPGIYEYTGDRDIASEPPPPEVFEESHKSTVSSQQQGRVRTSSLSFLNVESTPVVRAQCDSSGISDDGKVVWQTLEEKPAFSTFSPREKRVLPPTSSSYVTHSEFKERALALTSNHGHFIDVSRFSQEYMRIYAVKRVPYVQLGYPRLIDCLRAIPEITHRLPPPGSTPLKPEFFRARALEIIPKIRCPFKIEVFSRTYRVTYSVREIPYRELGFSTLFECLLSIPEVARNLDIALELEVLEIVKEWRSAFHPLKIIHPFRTRNNTDRMPPWREYFYDSASELMSSLPGVACLATDLFAFKGDPQLIPSIHETIRNAKGEGTSPPVLPPTLDIQMPSNVSAREDVHEEEPLKEERLEKEEMAMSEEKEAIGGSKSRDSFSNEPEPTFLPQKASDDLLSASATEDESRSDFTNPNSVGHLPNHFHRHHPSAPPHCCQSSVVHPPSTFSRNEHYGRLLTSLLDDAERRGENADELAVKALNTVMGFRLEEEKKK